MTLDEMIQESIDTWKPLQFTRDDLDKKKYKIIGWTSLEVEKEINRLWEQWYVPIGGISCAYTSHWLVYAILMENLYYNFMPDEQVGGENYWQDYLWGADWEWELSWAWASEDTSWGYDWQATWELS